MKKIGMALCLAALLTTACSSTDEKKVERLCPQTAVLRDLERVRDYGNETPDEKTLVAAAIMKNVHGACEYNDEGADLNFRLTMLAGRGPRLGGNRVSFPYFISVLDPRQKVLSKELLTADFRFHGDDKITEQVEELHVFIPMAKDADGTNYQVLMGFQLTEEQRKAKR